MGLLSSDKNDSKVQETERVAADAAAGKPMEVPQAFGNAFRALLIDDSLDAAFVAEALALPSEAYLLDRLQPADPAPLRAALIHLTRALGLAMKADFLSRYLDLEVDGEYRYHPLDAGKRALRNQCLRYLTAAGSATAIPTLSEWGLIVMSLLAAGWGLVAVRRRNEM